MTDVENRALDAWKVNELLQNQHKTILLHIVIHYCIYSNLIKCTSTKLIMCVSHICNNKLLYLILSTITINNLDLI